MMPTPPHVQEIILLHFIDCSFDGTNELVSIQVHLPTGIPVALWVEKDGRAFVCQMHDSRNSMDPEKVFSNFQCKTEPMYPSQCVQTISWKKVLEAWSIIYEMHLCLPIKVNHVFPDKEGWPGQENVKYSKTGEIHAYLELIEEYVHDTYLPDFTSDL